MQLHVITGTPRSGSTLLRNILAQNPAFHVSATSPLTNALFALQQVMSRSDELKSELIADTEGTQQRLLRAFHGFVAGWYSEHKDKTCFDTSRAWSPLAQLHAQLFPGSIRIVCVRDLRAIFGSIEKQHAKFPLLDAVENVQQKTVADRATRLFSPGGLIGASVSGVEDLIRRQLPRTVLVQYEWFVRNPDQTMERIYSALRMAKFEHTFDNVKRRTTECDALYLNKFPHEGSGEVTSDSLDTWRPFCPPDIEREIMIKFPGYNRAFGYVGV